VQAINKADLLNGSRKKAEEEVMVGKITLPILGIIIYIRFIGTHKQYDKIDVEVI